MTSYSFAAKRLLFGTLSYYSYIECSAFQTVSCFKLLRQTRLQYDSRISYIHANINVNTNMQKRPLHKMQALQLPFFPDDIIQLPYSDLGRQLFGDLGIAKALSGNVPEEQTGIVLESIGHDILVFLLASVVGKLSTD